MRHYSRISETDGSPRMAHTDHCGTPLRKQVNPQGYIARSDADRKSLARSPKRVQTGDRQVSDREIAALRGGLT